MDFAQWVAVLWKRWYVVLPVLLLTVSACAAAYSVFPPSYDAKAQVVLLAPSTVGLDGTASNPYLDFNSALQTTSTVVSEVMLDPSATQKLRAAGMNAKSYTVTPTGFGVAPLIELTADDANPAVALASMHVLLANLPTQLQDLQQTAGAPKTTWITAREVTVNDRAHRVLKTFERVAAAIIVLGILLALAAAHLSEWIVRRGRARRTIQSDPSAPQESPRDFARVGRENLTESVPRRGVHGTTSGNAGVEP